MLKTNKTQIICARYLGIFILMQDPTLHPLFLLATTTSPHSFVHVQKRGAREPPKNFSRPPERFIHSHIYSFFHIAKIQINKKVRFIEITKTKWFMILFLKTDFHVSNVCAEKKWLKYVFLQFLCFLLWTRPSLFCMTTPWIMQSVSNFPNYKKWQFIGLSFCVLIERRVFIKQTQKFSWNFDRKTVLLC